MHTCLGTVVHLGFIHTQNSDVSRIQGGDQQKVQVRNRKEGFHRYKPLLNGDPQQALALSYRGDISLSRCISPLITKPDQDVVVLNA